MNKVFLLLDNFGEESRLLYESFKNSGFDGPVLVIHEDGFLPKGVQSVYRYFCGDFKGAPGVKGKARYFNEIEAPDYWEISATNAKGKVHDLYHERGRIFYAEPAYKRLVKTVDWLDENGKVRISEHYDDTGALYAKTIFNKKEQKFCKVYLDAKGREVLVENYVTEDIILNRDGKVYFLKNKTDLTLKMIEELGIEGYTMYYNSLSIPLFASERLGDNGHKDVLIWQEGPREDVPGNMTIIINGSSSRTAKILVQNKKSAEKLIEHGVPKELISILGFVYTYEGENTYGNEALICTNSDEIEKLKEIVEALPQIKFHILAITEMSNKLLDMGNYQNVMVYPSAKPELIDKLYKKCDFYLDINHGGEIVSAVKTAFLHNQVVLGFRNTLHNAKYIAGEHIFDDYEDIVALLSKLNGNKEEVDEHLKVQKASALEEKPGVYEQLFKVD